MANRSDKVVYAALAANLVIAGAKFIASAVSGSSAMLTEAVHSSADCTNQLLLLIGVRRGKLPSDPSHQFGYGMEIYFWTFVVAMLVLVAGGAYSILRGVLELRAPHPVQAPLASLVVLFVSAVFELASFSVGYREFKTVVARHRGGGQSVNLIQFIKWSKDPSVYESLLEDAAAIAGIVVATIGIVASAYQGFIPADGIASVIIGMILVGNGIAILVATRSLIAGEAVAPPILSEFQASLRGHSWSNRISDLSTLHLGPSCILAAVSLMPRTGGISDTELGGEVERLLKAVDDRVIEVLFRFVSDNGPPIPG